MVAKVLIALNWLCCPCVWRFMSDHQSTEKRWSCLFFLLSWTSYSVSWLECWGRETPTRRDMRSSSARTTAPALKPLQPAPASHHPHPLTTSSELNSRGGGKTKPANIVQSVMSNKEGGWTTVKGTPEWLKGTRLLGHRVRIHCRLLLAALLWIIVAQRLTESSLRSSACGISETMDKCNYDDESKKL